MKKTVIDFTVENDLATSSENKGIKAMKEASKIAEENGISFMTLDEINEEIKEVRKKSQ